MVESALATFGGIFFLIPYLFGISTVCPRADGFFALAQHAIAGLKSAGVYALKMSAYFQSFFILGTN